MVMFQSKYFGGLQRAYERGLSESGGNPPKKLGDNMQFSRTWIWVVNWLVAWTASEKYLVNGKDHPIYYGK